jgi:hypothetical protein
MGAYSYSGTAASNTTVDGIGAAGSDSPDNIDNLVRALAASDANLVRDLGGANTVSGTADAIAVALADASTPAYFDGMRFSFRAASDTTVTGPTLNVDSLGAKTIKKTIQGVESALVAGDIQAGQTVEVVYRSAWASAAGAFELLTTGNGIIEPAGSTTGDTLYRASTGYTRLAVGTNGQVMKVGSSLPSWGGVSTFETAQATTSGTAIDFNSIPSWVREIDVIFEDVSLSGSDLLLVQIGDSGGIETTGYSAASTNFYVANDYLLQTTTSGFFGGYAGNASNDSTGILSLKNISGNIWIASGVFEMTGSAMVTSAGSKTLSATLDRVRITRSGSNTFDTGSVNICYR